MLRLIYELGCRVSEFTQVQLKHLDFEQSTVFFPASNTKTGHERTSHVPRELMNDIKEHLRRQGLMTRRGGRIRQPQARVFRSVDQRTLGMTPNRVRQIFRHYAIQSGLDRDYGTDSKGRRLHQFSVHSLRHSHVMHALHEYKIPVPIVQRQVGHRTLDATMTYCRPTDEMIGQYYEKARAQARESEMTTGAYCEVSMQNGYRGPM